MVHQHFMLVPVFTVAENVVLGFEPTRAKVFYDRRKGRRRHPPPVSGVRPRGGPDAVVEDIPVASSNASRS